MVTSGSWSQLWNKKDNFHICIFGIDKRAIFDTVVSKIPIKLSLSKRGVVDGERPLKASPTI
jgi:hypothetical protein